MRIKFNRNSWYIKMLGVPQHWCSLMWGLMWRASAVVVGAFALYWLVYLLIVGNYHVFFSEDPNDGWIAGGLIFDFVILYACGAVGFIQRREIAKWTNEHCPKLEYEDE